MYKAFAPRAAKKTKEIKLPSEKKDTGAMQIAALKNEIETLKLELSARTENIGKNQLSKDLYSTITTAYQKTQRHDYSNGAASQSIKCPAGTYTLRFRATALADGATVTATVTGCAVKTFEGISDYGTDCEAVFEVASANPTLTVTAPYAFVENIRFTGSFDGYLAYIESLAQN